MIDFTKIQNCIVNVVDLLVGEMLSRGDSLDNPAIIREFSAVARPKNPYITFDITDNGSQFNNSHDEYFNEQGEYVIESIHSVSVRFVCYGDAAKTIISKLYSGFKRPSTRRIIEEKVPELTMSLLRDIKTIEILYDTQYITSSSFSVMFDCASKEIDPLTSYIDTIEIETCLLNELDEPDIVTIIEVPTTPFPLNDLSGNN